MSYIIFEDDSWVNFLPFSYLRMVGDQRVGILKLRQRLGLFFNFDPINVIIRKDLELLYRIRHEKWSINLIPKGEHLFLNSRLRINKELQAQINDLELGQKLVKDSVVLAFKIHIPKKIQISAEELPSLYQSLASLSSPDNLSLWTYNWDFIKENGQMLTTDFDLLFEIKDNFLEIEQGVTALNPYQIWIGEGVQLQQGVIIDASGGPIVIDEGSVIMHQAVIVGPAYIGKNTIIKIGAKIYGNSSIGPHCKIGGEVEDVIIQAYSNKQHDGFIGHSILGEWVNIGADTNNSDLKNNYRGVKVWLYPERERIDTHELFMGCFIGDHSKIGINSIINTGTVIGLGVNIHGSGLINGFVPSFSFGDSQNQIRYDLEKFNETALIVKNRRQLGLTEEEKNIFQKLYKEYFHEKRRIDQ